MIGPQNEGIAAQLARIVDLNEERLNAVMRQSMQEVIDIAQTPGYSVAGTKAAIREGLGKEGRGKKKRFRQGPVAANGKGGKMRVDTGFLRASGSLSLNGMPSGPTRPPKEGGAYNYDANVTELALGNAQLGDTIYFGWSASYAKYREAYDGFMVSAVAKFPSIVARIVSGFK